MNASLRRVLQAFTVSLPLMLGPLGAQESATDEQKPAADEPARVEPAAGPAKEAPPASAGKPAATSPPPDADDAGTEENVSADNSLSFPVDI